MNRLSWTRTTHPTARGKVERADVHRSQLAVVVKARGQGGELKMLYYVLLSSDRSWLVRVLQKLVTERQTSAIPSAACSHVYVMVTLVG